MGQILEIPPIINRENETTATILKPQFENMDSAGMDLPCFKDLIAVLFECFLIISLGYLSCRYKVISIEAKDLNSYLTTFALPTIIFLNIARMEFQTINLTFIACMFAAKLLILILVTILTLTISHPTNYAYAGTLSILATQSNDFALGYPLIKSLYGEEKREMLTYLSFMAPIQLLIINPLGIVLLEYEKSRRLKRTSSDAQNRSHSSCQVCSTNRSVSTGTDFPNLGKLRRQSTGGARVTTAPLSVSARQIVERESSVNQGTLRKRSFSTTQRPELNSSQTSNEDMNVGVLPLGSFKYKNIKSLVLSMPTRNNVIDNENDGSSQSISQTYDTECKLVYYDGAQTSQQTRCDTPQAQYDAALSSRLSSTNVNLPDTLTKTVEQRPCVCQTIEIAKGKSGTGSNLLKALASNPLIIASVVALFVNLVHGPELPKLVSRVSNTIAASFAAPALFVVGLSMYGKFELLLKNPNDLLLASSIVLTKELILPNVMRTLTLVILPTSTPTEEASYLVDFSFLYGLLPMAPTACIIAKQYGVLPNVVSISMLLSIITSAPMMLAAAVIINPSNKMNVKDIENIIARTMKTSSLITLFLAPVTLYSFWRAKRSLNYTNLINISDIVSRRIEKVKQSPIRVFLFLLAISQVVIALGGLTWFFVDPNKMSNNLPNLVMSGQSNGTILTDNMQFNLDSAPKLDHTFKLLSNIQYVLSSSGLMMARFAVMSIVIIMAATRFKDLATATRISSILLLVTIPLGLCILVVSFLDSDQQQHSAVDPSLPAPTKSLYLRLIYNLIFLFVSIPLFAFISRSENKSRKMLSIAPVEDQPVGSHLDSSLVARPFVTSIASLDSASSSALTINTNLEASVNSINCTNPAYEPNNSQTGLVDTMSIVIDCKNIDQARRPVSPLEDQSINPASSMFGTYGSTVAEEQRRKKDQYEGDNHPSGENNLNQTLNLIRISEFNRYSILIVFMLIASILNLTSIIQKLVLAQQFGTFRQIEVLTVGMEFGQGLVTFLIYGMKGLSR